MPRLLAASISMKSKELEARVSPLALPPEAISRQETQVRQGSTVGRISLPTSLRQSRAMARMRAMVVLPMPR